MFQTLKDKLPLAAAIASLAMLAMTLCFIGAAVFIAVTAEKPCKTCPAVSAPGSDTACQPGQCVCGQSCVCHPCTLRHYPARPTGPFTTSCPYCRRSIVVQPTGQVAETAPAPE